MSVDDNIDKITELFNSPSIMQVINALLYRTRKNVDPYNHANVVLRLLKPHVNIITMSNMLSTHKMYSTSRTKKIVLREQEVIDFYIDNQELGVKGALQYLLFAKMYFIIDTWYMKTYRYTDDYVYDVNVYLFVSELEKKLADKTQFQYRGKINDKRKYVTLSSALVERYEHMVSSLTYGSIREYFTNFNTAENINDIHSMIAMGCHFICMFGFDAASIKAMDHATKFTHKLMDYDVLSSCILLLNLHMRSLDECKFMKALEDFDADFANDVKTNIRIN